MPCQSGPCCRSTSADTKSQGDQVTQTAECRTGPLLPRHPLGKTNTSLHFRQPSSNGWSGVRSANAAWPLAVHASALLATRFNVAYPSQQVLTMVPPMPWKCRARMTATHLCRLSVGYPLNACDIHLAGCRLPEPWRHRAPFHSTPTERIPSSQKQYWLSS